MPRTPTSRRRHLSARVGLVVVLAFAAAGCGGDEDDSDDAGTDPTSPETTTTPSTTTPLTPEDAAKATYLEFVEVVDRLVTQTPDPDDPDLVRLATDPVLGGLRDNLATLVAENQIWRPGDRTSHHVYAAEINEEGDAVLRDCVVENDVLVDSDDGSVIRAAPLTTRDLTVTLLLDGGLWVVSEIETVEAFDGEVSCA